MAVTGAKRGRPKKRGVDATTITLSISAEDKALARAMAEKRSVTVSDLLHRWIAEAARKDAAADARMRKQQQARQGHDDDLLSGLFGIADSGV